MQLCDDMNIPITEIDMGDSFSIGEMKLKALFTNKDSRELFLKYSKTLNSIDNLELYNEILEELKRFQYWQEIDKRIEDLKAGKGIIMPAPLGVDDE